MGPEKTARNTVPTNSNIRSGSATATAVRPTTPKAQQATAGARPGTTGKSTKITHEQIALRAREIYMKRGCRPGQDEQNWLEAEAQLKAERGVK
jgi:hypothetical protein